MFYTFPVIKLSKSNDKTGTTSSMLLICLWTMDLIQGINLAFMAGQYIFSNIIYICIIVNQVPPSAAWDGDLQNGPTTW